MKNLLRWLVTGMAVTSLVVAALMVVKGEAFAAASWGFAFGAWLNLAVGVWMGLA